MLPTDAYGRQRCNVVLSDVLFYTCGVCPRLCARERGQQKQTKFYRYARTKWASCRETREIVLSTPVGKKNFERLPRELQCSDRAQTSTNVSGRASCVGVLSVLPKVILRRDMFQRRRNFTIIDIHTRLPFGEWDVPRGVTQAGMPQGKIINRHPAVPLVA